MAPPLVKSRPAARSVTVQFNYVISEAAWNGVISIMSGPPPGRNTRNSKLNPPITPPPQPNPEPDYVINFGPPETLVRRGKADFLNEGLSNITVASLIKLLWEGEFENAVTGRPFAQSPPRPKRPTPPKRPTRPAAAAPQAAAPAGTTRAPK